MPGTAEQRFRGIKGNRLSWLPVSKVFLLTLAFRWFLFPQPGLYSHKWVWKVRLDLLFQVRFFRISESIYKFSSRGKFRLPWYLGLFLHRWVQSWVEVWPRQKYSRVEGTSPVPVITNWHIHSVHIFALGKAWLGKARVSLGAPDWTLLCCHLHAEMMVLGCEHHLLW